MSKSNPQIAIDSLPLTRSYQLGPNVADPLTPDAFCKSGNYFLNTWREQSCQNGDWGSTWNYICPESLNVVSSHFLEIDLPAIGGGTYKAVPGLYAIQKLKLLSNGSEVYDLDYTVYMREFLSSVTDEEYAQFVECYMGGVSSTGDARTICCPLFLPNSHYLRRHSHVNYGIFPHKLNTKLEFQITMATGARMASQGSGPPGSITNTARIVTREIKGDQNAIVRKYADARGQYSLCVPRYQEVVPFKTLTANTKDSQKLTLPTGCVYEFIVEAYPSTHSLEETDRRDVTLPSNFKITADGEDIRVLDNSTRVLQELFTNGYRSNINVNNAGRIAFAHRSSFSDHCFQGALHCGNVSSLQSEVEFASDVRYRILAKKYSKVRIQANGVLRSALE